jgi:hypothetical protein
VHSGKYFYLLTDADKVYDYKVVRIAEDEVFSKPESQLKFEDFFLPEQGEIITDIDIFEDKLALYVKKSGSSLIYVVNLGSWVNTRLNHRQGGEENQHRTQSGKRFSRAKREL